MGRCQCKCHGVTLSGTQREPAGSGAEAGVGGGGQALA